MRLPRSYTGGRVRCTFFSSGEKSRLSGSNSRPNVSEGYDTSERPGRPAGEYVVRFFLPDGASTRWAFLFYFLYIFSEKNIVYRDRTHVPTCQKATIHRLPRSYRGDRGRVRCTFFQPRLPGSNSRPNVSEGYEVTSELPGRPAGEYVVRFFLPDGVSTRWAFIFIFIFIFILVRKISFTGIKLTSQRVRRLRGYLGATGATGGRVRCTGAFFSSGWCLSSL